jgi:DNA-binding LacI/PurR family transcriptional regulator
MTTSTRASGDRRRATIEDVATAAGVSVATVSRALRGLPNVAFSTRELVRTVADSLDYHADPAAARLATGRSRAIGIAVPLLNGWYFSQVVAGAEAVCTEAGYDLIVMGVTGDEARGNFLHGRSAVHRRVDALVMVDIPLTPEETEQLAGRGLPVVTVGGITDRFPSVGIDDVEVGRLATAHLIGLGHRRIALLGGQPEDPLGFDVPDLRRHGYERAHAEAGLPVDPRLLVGGNFSVTGGYEAMSALLGLGAPPTAVFAMSDEMAFGALWALRVLGLRAPEDLSVIGVDDHDVSAAVDLTTVRQRVADHGARAARLLIDGLTGATVTAMRHQNPVELVQRGTTGPPTQHDPETPRKP